MPKTRPKPDSMPIRIKLDLLDRLQEYSKDTGASIGWIVNKAVRDMFERIDKKK
jgi:predicted transcriptional regulator